MRKKDNKIDDDDEKEVGSEKNARMDENCVEEVTDSVLQKWR